MSFQTSGLEQLKLQLQRLKSVPVAANAELKECAEEMADLARRMAPVDKANLEKAIKVRFDRSRNALGQFAGGSYEVYVDNDMPVDGRNGKTVGDYAWLQHEHLTPAGPWQLGEKSVEKQNANPDIEVGGKFLERAGEAYRKIINVRLGKVVRKYIEALDIE